MKRVPALLTGIALVWIFSGIASAQEPEAAEPIVVRVAYTNWLSWGEARKDEEIAFFQTYLARLQEKSGEIGGIPQAVRFQIALGNYYQVLAWMKAGLVDAAVATPLVATALERDGVAVSSFELASKHQNGYIPVVAARGPGTAEPMKAYESYLGELLALLSEKAPNPELLGRLRTAYRIHFVSHLSASGFVMPLLYAEKWLSGQRATSPEIEDRFWKTLIDDAHFVLFHPSDGEDDPNGATDIYFSYCSSMDEGRCAMKTPVWRPYEVGAARRRNPGEAPVIERAVPNDVFVIRPDVASRIQWPKSNPAIQDLLIRPAAAIASKYNIQPVRPIVQSKFRERVLALLFPVVADDRHLPSMANQWFDQGRFAFTIEETLNFLRQDQRNSKVPALSLVLSGGGVKSLYQAELLNHLYALDNRSPRELQNFETSPAKSGGRESTSEPLIVHSIIGTSGGAMLAFFAAQLPGLPNTLTELMGGMAAKNVFPYFGIPRVVSVLALLILFLLGLVIARTVSQTYRDLAKSVGKGAPLRLFNACVLVFVGGVTALRVVRGYNFEHVSVFEGLFFFVAAVVLHLVTTCAVRSGSHRQQRAIIEGRTTVLFGATLVIAATAVALTFRNTQGYERSDGPLLLSLLVSAGTLTTAIGIARLISGGAGNMQLQDLPDYFKGLAVLALFLGTTYLALIVLSRFGGSLLEVTGVFWIALGLSGSLIALALLVLLWKQRQSPVLKHLRIGLVALMRDRVRGVTTTMMTTLVLAGVQGMALWILLIAPAVYSNYWALQAIRSAVPEDHLDRSGFNANLVVTGALLSKPECEPDLAPGGLYMCFEGGPGCETARGRNWRVFRKPNATRAIDAVFASGSPFPMFPRHLAHTPGGCAIRLIDGGYAHNIPLDAARSLGGRQVLIINASPEESEEKEGPIQMTGQLVHESPRLLSFMFDRAQALDQSAGGTLLVASLGPHFDKDQNNFWPFLLDFRPEARKLVYDQARADIEGRRRIGRILNWGLPIFVEIDKPR